MPFDYCVPRPFSSSAVRQFAPAVSGIYGISNRQEWLYIGVTTNIQDALLAHLREVGASLMKRAPTGFVFEICEQSGHTARQNRLVQEYRPFCNRHSAASR